MKRLEEFVRRGQAAQDAAVKAGALPVKEKYCPQCHGSGKLDRGNGSTKPCDCIAGLIESQRRRLKRLTRGKKGGAA